MKESFRKDIEQYSRIAKQDMSGELEGQKLETILGWHINEAQKRQGTTQESQGRIYQIQKQKQELMAKLKEQLRLEDLPNEGMEKQKDKLLVTAYNPETKTATCALKDGTKVEISLGEIMTDGEWGLEYYLDHESIPRNVRKKYLVEHTKRQLRDYLDSQLIESAVSSNENYQNSWRNVKRDRESGEIPIGIVAEKMIRNFIKKLTYNENLDIDVVETDVWEDINRGIDFIIHRKVNSRYRGVKVEASEKEGVSSDVKPLDVAVQFAAGKSTRAFKKKKLRNIQKTLNNLRPEDRIGDVIFLRVFIDDLRQNYEKWLEKRVPGGPDSPMNDRLKKTLFDAIFHGDMALQDQETKLLSIFHAKKDSVQ